MSSPELALVARAQGVSTHLLSREVLESLSEAPDLPALARAMARLGPQIEPAGETADIDAIDQAIRRTAARHLRTLGRWQQRSPGVLDAFWADQDRRNLRALIRGALQGAPVASRLSGLLPTPRLPDRVLTELARQASPRAVVHQLLLMGDADAGALQPHVQKAQPDLFAIEVTLLQAMARRATAAAHNADDTLRQYVRERIDVGNVQNALLITGAPRDVDVAAAFVEGGRWLSRQAFAAAAGAASPQAALASMTTALAGSPLAASLPLVAGDASRLERAFLASTLERLHRLARTEPMGSARLLGVLLRLDAQARDLRAVAWGAALGTPPAMRRQQLVTPWR
ncbi:MAG: V-type ATPase subunit [Vicinamibacterales bacterium]